MSRTTTTTTTTKAEAETPTLPAPVAAFYAQVTQDAADVAAAQDMDALRSLFGTQVDREAKADRLVGIAAVASWQTRGEIIGRAATILRGLTLDQVTQKIGTEIAHDANGLGLAVDAISRAQVGRYLEAAKADVRRVLRDADDALGTPSGPASTKATDVLVWCKAERVKQGAQGIKVGSNAGKATVTLAEANAAKAAATTKRAEAEAKAKATSDADRAKVRNAKSDTRLGLVTKRQLAEAKAAQDVDALRLTIRYCEAALADIAEAKARAEAKAKADAAKAKGAKAEADDMVQAAHADAETMRARIAELEAALAAK